MNENEMKMIKEMAEMLIDAQDKCELNPCNECEHQGCREGCWHYLSATELYKKGGRIVADDEIVIKKRQYEQLKKYNRDRKRLRLRWQQAKQDLDDIYSNGFVLLVEHHEIVDQVARETKQETTREILQAINKYLVGTRGIYTVKTFRNCRFEDIVLVRADDLETLVKKLAKEHGIELED